MLRKLTLGLVAAATLGAMALAPSAASAKPWGGGWGGGFGGYHHHWGHGFGGDYGDDCAIRRAAS
jgi:Spy/CpxP family protein refolding chaperone